MRPDVQAMMSKVDFGVDPVAEAAGFHKMTTIITITLKDGRVIKGAADFGRGSPAMPMTYDEVADKFRENCEFAKFSSAKANQVVELVRRIETVSSIRELTSLLSV
jgi:2-methylcitrate dehydratase PrpD